MKRLTILWAVYFAAMIPSSLTWAQETNGNSLQNILNGLAQADYGSAAEVYDLDVVGYFDLGETYDTDLKMKVFKRTPEYVELLDSLKLVRSQMLRSKFYLEMADPWSGSTASYDVKQGGFYISFGLNFGSAPVEARPPKYVEGFLLTALPTKQYVFASDLIVGENDLREERLFLKVSETNGLEIENNPDSVRVYFIFNISGKKTVYYKFFAQSEGGMGTYKETRLEATQVRVLLANSETGKIYFDKTFKSK